MQGKTNMNDQLEDPRSKFAMKSGTIKKSEYWKEIMNDWNMRTSPL